MELWNHLFSKYPFICSCYFLCYYKNLILITSRLCRCRMKTVFFKLRQFDLHISKHLRIPLWHESLLRPSLALIDRLVSSIFSTVGKLLALLNAIHSSGLIFLHSFRYNTFKKNRKLSNSEIINV